MKLKKLFFKDKTSEWSLESIFFEKPTNLVGASGVGKTQILNTVFALNLERTNQILAILVV